VEECAEVMSGRSFGRRCRGKDLSGLHYMGPKAQVVGRVGRDRRFQKQEIKIRQLTGYGGSAPRSDWGKQKGKNGWGEY